MTANVPIISPQGGYAGSKGRVSDETRGRILELHGEGLSVRAIARQTEVSTFTVSRTVHAAGLSFDQESTHRATVERVKKLRAKRLDLAADLAITASMAVALAQEQMIMEPSNHRGRAESLKGVQSAASALADLLRVDQPTATVELELEGAESFIDGVMIGLRDLADDDIGPGQVITIRGGYPPAIESGDVAAPTPEFPGLPPHDHLPQEPE